MSRLKQFLKSLMVFVLLSNGICSGWQTPFLQPLTEIGPKPISAPYGATEKLKIVKHGGIEFSKGDGWRLTLDVYEPEKPGCYPGVLMLHGGAWAWGSKLHWRFHARRLAQQGFVVVTANYRLAPKHKFPAQIQDARMAIRWMKHNADQFKIDRERMAAYGYSAGGNLALLLATTNSESSLDDHTPAHLKPYDASIQAVIAGGSPCDFQFLPRNSRFLVYWLGSTKSQNPKVYLEASPLDNLDPSDKCDFFFYHSEWDWMVPLSSTERMHETAIKQGHTSTFVILKKKEHVGGFFDTKIVDDVAAFLKSNLRE